ncbi:Bromodomain-containing protein [Vararia minispora EC-137]|uniref:Bromodomain-containing protein n=1 Tax=Vararia minispora EC-137 TaxID=1314806 RepID=A0ACB8QRA5_9AGAM|nr:Bromodomain-containing protein [Vararia minispora EC-137]
MSKRELETLAQAAVDIDAPRTKRRKETPTEDLRPGPSKGGKTAAPGSAEESVEAGNAHPQDVKAKAGQLWQAIKDATAEDGRSLSYDFYHLPNKRKYSDYYQIISHPIALDLIKTRIDEGYYQTVRAAKDDLELCFRNAKKYNLKESQIYADAKNLHVR